MAVDEIDYKFKCSLISKKDIMFLYRPIQIIQISLINIISRLLKQKQKLYKRKTKISYLLLKNVKNGKEIITLGTLGDNNLLCAPDT